MIEVNALTKRYGATTAVHNLTFTVQPGQVTGFLGPNGAGKSTTLRMILGLHAPTSGTATVDGRPFRDRSRGLRHVGSLLDAQDVHGGHTAAAHLSALARSNRIPRSRVAEVLEEAGLAAAARRRIGGFSLAMKQRLGSALIMMLALGALMIIGEYSTGTIRPTLAAIPARRSVMAAKAAVLTTVTTVFGAFVATASFSLTQAILNGRDLGVSITHPGALQVVLASTVLAPVCALTGMALGAIIRHTAATMTASAAVLVLIPLMLTSGRYWSAVAGHAMPYHAWLRLVTPHPQPTQFPWTTTGAWTVYAVWLLAAATLAITSLHRRDQ